MATKAFNSATLTAKVLASRQLTSTASTAVYTCPASSCAKIANASICNTSASPVAITVALVQSGNTDDGTHSIVAGYNLAANDTLPLGDLLGGHMLGAGDFIAVTAGTANVIDVVITGAEGA